MCWMEAGHRIPLGRWGSWPNMLVVALGVKGMALPLAVAWRAGGLELGLG